MNFSVKFILSCFPTFLKKVAYKIPCVYVMIYIGETGLSVCICATKEKTYSNRKIRMVIEIHKSPNNPRGIADVDYHGEGPHSLANKRISLRTRHHTGQ